MSTTSNILKRLTARLPETWRGKVTDRKLASWLRSIPDTLPPDSGGGTFRRSFALSTEASEQVKLHARQQHEDPSAWLRRLIAAKLGPAPAALPSRPLAPASRSSVEITVKPVPAVRRITRADARPYSEDQAKKDFQKYIAELETIVRPGKPEAGEAQVRLARIRQAQRAQKLAGPSPDRVT